MAGDKCHNPILQVERQISSTYSNYKQQHEQFVNHASSNIDSQQTQLDSLQQQIKIMELEIIYLKTADGSHVEGAVEESHPKGENAMENEETISKIKYELQTALARVENIKLEKAKLHDRMKYLDKQRDEEKSKLLEQISRLTGRVEHLEKESENNEIRQSSILQVFSFS